MAPTADELRVVRAAYAAFARGDLAGVIGVFAEDAIWDATDALWTTGTFFGHDGIADYFRQLEGLWTEVRLEDYDIEVVRAGTLLVRGRLRGHEETTGQHVDVPFLHWVDVADGKITRLRILVDPDRAG